jgi:hypothetical protein
MGRIADGLGLQNFCAQWSYILAPPKFALGILAILLGQLPYRRLCVSPEVKHSSTKFTPSWCMLTILIASTPFLLFPSNAVESALRCCLIRFTIYDFSVSP